MIRFREGGSWALLHPLRALRFVRAVNAPEPTLEEVMKNLSLRG